MEEENSILSEQTDNFECKDLEKLTLVTELAMHRRLSSLRALTELEKERGSTCKY